jgi:MFS superfamily sulfate permease-like transporter
MSPVIAAVLSLITVLALTPLFTDLPEAVLAAMIIHAVSHLMKVAEMRRFYQLRRREFWLGMITLLGVIVLDVLPALLIGVILSILVLAFMASRPVFSLLGTHPVVAGGYEDIKRHDDALDLDANDNLDITSSEAVRKLADVLGRQHVRLALAYVHAPALDMLGHFEPAGGQGAQGGWLVFPTLESAVSWARGSIRADDAPEAEVGG